MVSLWSEFWRMLKETNLDTNQSYIMCSIGLYINISLVQEWSPGHHTGGPSESSKCEALRHGRHVHVVRGEERWSLFDLLFQKTCLCNCTFHHIDHRCAAFLSHSAERSVWLPSPSWAGRIICHSLTEEVWSVTLGFKGKISKFYRFKISTHIAALFSKPTTQCGYILILNKRSFILLSLNWTAVLRRFTCGNMVSTSFSLHNTAFIWSWKFTNCLHMGGELTL